MKSRTRVMHRNDKKVFNEYHLRYDQIMKQIDLEKNCFRKNMKIFINLKRLKNK